MSLFPWSEKYSVSVSEMDNQHKILIGYLNELFDAMSQGKSQQIIGTILSKLVNYTKTHFAEEERQLQRINYPDIGRQKREHELFIAKLHEFVNEYNSGKVTLSLEVSNFLKNWLANHISIEDKKYGPFFNKKGIK